MFRFSYSRFTSRLFPLLGIGPRRTSVVVTRDQIRASMGWSASITVSRSAVVSAEHSKKPFGYGSGVHGTPGRWVFNGSNDGIVKLTLDPPQRGRILIFPIKPRELYLSLEDPSGFLTELGFPS
ncbi:MAG: hypothetical protein ACRDHN_17260 [Thermomicrobiales bacterium]